MSLPTEKLVQWVATQISDITEEGMVRHFELLYAARDGHQRIEVFLLEDVREEMNAEEIAGILWTRCEKDAADRDGPTHRYELLAWREGQDVHDSLLTLRIRGRLSYSDPGETEPATEGGIVAQLMRHNERIMETMQRTVDASNGALVQQLETERASNQRLRATHESVLELKERLLSDDDSRTLAREEAARKAERQDAVLGMLIQHAPLMLTAFATALSALGKRNAGTATQTPAKSEGLATELKAFVSDIGADKLTRIAAVLDPDEQERLMRLLAETETEEKSHDHH